MGCSCTSTRGDCRACLVATAGKAVQIRLAIMATLKGGSSVPKALTAPLQSEL
jgi:hypothetical protein